jgi:acetyl-CoA acetyltransferase
LIVKKNLDEPAAAIGADAMSSLPKPADSLRWAFINGWNVEPQSNDRAPVSGTVAPHAASASARRSMTRRKHQAMFKEWSQSRDE